MDANRLLETGTDANKWFDLSKIHWISARYLSEKSFEVLPEPNGNLMRLDHDWMDDRRNYATPAHLLYGFALETAIKARIIQTKPEAVEYQLITNANHDITKVSLKGFGSNTRNWHGLVSLAEVAGLFNENFAQETDRESLDHFTDAIVWASKYPIPKESAQEEDRNTLYAIRNAERWLTNLHPNPLPLYAAMSEDADA